MLAFIFSSNKDSPTRGLSGHWQWLPEIGNLTLPRQQISEPRNQASILPHVALSFWPFLICLEPQIIWLINYSWGIKFPKPSICPHASQMDNRILALWSLGRSRRNDRWKKDTVTGLVLTRSESYWFLPDLCLDRGVIWNICVSHTWSNWDFNILQKIFSRCVHFIEKNACTVVHFWWTGSLVSIWKYLRKLEYF